MNEERQLLFTWDWITGINIGFDIIWDLGIQINLVIVTVFIFWGLKNDVS